MQHCWKNDDWMQIFWEKNLESCDARPMQNESTWYISPYQHPILFHDVSCIMQKTTEQFYLLCFFFWILKALFEGRRIPSPPLTASPKYEGLKPPGDSCSSFRGISAPKEIPKIENYFTSSDPHHDMLGEGCQVRVVIENMMGRMENLRTLISGFLGLVILVRWALVTMFLSWTTQTGCRIHRTYVSLIGSGEGRHTTHLLKCVPLLSTSQTDWKQSSDLLSNISFDILSDISSDISSDILSDISSDILFDIFLTYLLTFFLTNLLTLFLTYLLTFFLTYLSTCFLTYLLTFFLTYQNQNLTSTASHKKPLCKLYIYLTPRSKSNIHDNFVPVNVIALSASDRPAKRQLSPKMQNACSSTHTYTHASDRPAKRQLSPKMQKSLKCHNYISWRVQTMKSDARHCGSSAGSA